MKKLLPSVLAFVSVLLVILSTYVIRTEVFVHAWQDRVASVDFRQSEVNKLAVAQEYGRTAMSSCRMLAVENGLLCERDAKMTKYVAAMEEENTKLKASLAESVEHLQALIKDNNGLHDEVNQLGYKIQCLEQALTSTKAALKAALDTLKKKEDVQVNPFVKLLGYLQYTNEAVTALGIAL